MTLDDARIRDLIDFDDDDGVLSFYVGHTPAQAADPQPTTPIEIRNQLKTLRADLADRDGLAGKVEACLDRAKPDIDRLLDPHASGRGRALFIGVSSGRVESVALQIPFAERVVHHDSAYVRPLVAAQDEGRAAGVLDVNSDRARLLVWQLGEVTELWVREFEIPDDVSARQKTGPSTGNPATGGRTHREDFDDRVSMNRYRMLVTACEEAAKAATDAGWDRLIVGGNAKLRDDAHKVLADALPDEVRVLTSDHNLPSSVHEIAPVVWPLLRSVHRDREAVLVDEAVERGLGGNGGAVGLRNVCDALNEGRVRHLLFRDDLQLEGFRSDEDTLHPRVEGAIAEDDTVHLHREPLFVERLIEKAVGTGAVVTPVAAEIAGPLDEHEGVAALLRW